MKLTERTILVTGGSGGIGLELARRFLALGNTVAITGRNQEALDAATRANPGLRAYRSDVADPRAIEALREIILRDLPALDVLVNNAGIMRRLDLNAHSGDLDDVTREVDINLSGSIRMALAFLPHLKGRPDAAILNVSSGLAFVPLALSPVYCATKAAIHSFSQSLRYQLKDTSVRVVEIVPPAVDTALSDAFKGDIDPSQAMRVDVLGEKVVAGLRKGRTEIRPGLANVLKLMSRIAPDFAAAQLGKSADKMLAESRR